MSEHVVVTGADGFIGTHLAKKFVDCNVDVYAVVIKNSLNIKKLNGLKNVHIIEADLNDLDTDVFSSIPTAPIAFIHLAWDGVAPEKRDNLEYQMKNVNLSLNAVKLAAYLKAQRFILPGSTNEYAYCNGPINGNSKPSPINSYGASKIAVRYLCSALCNELKMSFIYVVITGIYAPDRMDSNIIYYTISSLLNHNVPKFTKLEQLWDYVHIDDVTEALYLISHKGKNKAFYTVGHGDNWSLYEYIYKIRDIINPEAVLGVGDIPYKDGIIPSSCVDLTELKEDTGFIPKISFDKGIAEIIDMIKQNMNDE